MDVMPATKWKTLLPGVVISGACALSIHVVMLQVLGVSFPDTRSTPVWTHMLIEISAITATCAFYGLARPVLGKGGLILSTVALFALTAMEHETVRGIIMNGVVTTAWLYPILQALPGLFLLFTSAALVVFSGELAQGRWVWPVAGAAIGFFVHFAVAPLVESVSSPLLSSLSYLGHKDVYSIPYGWNVLVPAYVSYLEPAVATVIMAALVWDRLSKRILVRLAQFVIIVLFMDGVALRWFLYAPFSSSPLGEAVLSESQFLFEATVLALLSGLTWHYASVHVATPHKSEAEVNAI
ncbi:hypothetical protein AA23498_2688 [Acetobacter nitrogenifigens DSM 23921 = NBRC 105050]|nr:hypothetical protein [Acetobacter nitrogenifigens]GBQ96627.1 hypothetical protein AA23498_2688 [Acetobacter nitrogenifigens DSM 23921 = NBRC 105050]